MRARSASSLKFNAPDASILIRTILLLLQKLLLASSAAADVLDVYARHGRYFNMVNFATCLYVLGKATHASPRRPMSQEAPRKYPAFEMDAPVLGPSDALYYMAPKRAPSKLLVLLEDALFWRVLSGMDRRARSKQAALTPRAVCNIVYALARCGISYDMAGVNVWHGESSGGLTEGTATEAELATASTRQRFVRRMLIKLAEVCCFHLKEAQYTSQGIAFMAWGFGSMGVLPVVSPVAAALWAAMSSRSLAPPPPLKDLKYVTALLPITCRSAG